MNCEKHCNNELNFKIEENSLTFGIQENTMGFNIKEGFNITQATSYLPLTDKPQINSVVLVGNKLSEELGLEPTIIDITEQDIDNMIYGG